MLLKRQKYRYPSAESVLLQLEGVIADSLFPRIKDGNVQYYEYETTPLENSEGGDVIIL
jgi:hypothetical protein